MWGVRVPPTASESNRSPMTALRRPDPRLVHVPVPDHHVHVPVVVRHPAAGRRCPRRLRVRSGWPPSRFLSSRSCASRKFRNLTFLPCFLTAWSISSTTCSLLDPAVGVEDEVEDPLLEHRRVERRLHVLERLRVVRLLDVAAPPSRWGRRRGTPSRACRSRRDRGSSRSC